MSNLNQRKQKLWIESSLLQIRNNENGFSEWLNSTVIYDPEGPMYWSLSENDSWQLVNQTGRGKSEQKAFDKAKAMLKISVVLAKPDYKFFLTQVTCN